MVNNGAYPEYVIVFHISLSGISSFIASQEENIEEKIYLWNPLQVDASCILVAANSSSPSPTPISLCMHTNTCTHIPFCFDIGKFKLMRNLDKVLLDTLLKPLTLGHMIHNLSSLQYSLT